MSAGNPSRISGFGAMVAAGAAVAWCALLVWIGLHLRGWIEGDAATYTAMARVLAQGRWDEGGWIADALRAPYESLQEPVGGPFWNTAVLPGGRLVYTVAPGYPLWLAGMKVMAGYPGLLYANLVLLFGLGIALLVLTAGEARNPSRVERIQLAALALIAPLALPWTFLQFAGHWREPLFTLLLTLAVCGAMRFHRAGGAAAVAAVAGCLGAMVSVKEANAIYAPVFALWMLCAPPFRTARAGQRAAWLAAAALSFVVGALPLIYQNTLYTGLPWRSLHVARETAQFSLTQSGLGLSGGNVGWTVASYLRLFRETAFSAWPILLLGAVGCAVAARRPLGRLLLGITAVHLAVYLQWGRADLRHMYVLSFPAVYVLYCGANGLGDWIGRGRAGRAQVAGAAVWFAVVAWFSGGSARAVASLASQRDTVDRIGGLIRELAVAAGGSEGVWLANKPLVQILHAGRGASSFRLQELYNVAGPDVWLERIDQDLLAGRRVFFVSAPDTDPMHHAVVDWDAKDRADLSARFRLRRLAEIPLDRFARFGADPPPLELFALDRLTSHVAQASISLPNERLAWIRLPPVSNPGTVAVTLDDAPLPSSRTLMRAVPHAPIGTEAFLRAIAPEGVLMPDLDAAATIAAGAEIEMDFGWDANPPDHSFVEGGGTPQPAVGYRLFDAPATLYLPVNRDEGRMPLAALVFRAGIPRPGSVVWRVEGTARTALVSRAQAWLSLDGAPMQDAAYPVAIESPTDTPLPLDRVRILPLFREWMLPSGGDGGWIVQARVAGTNPDGGEAYWRLTAGDIEVDAGRTPPGPEAHERQWRIAPGLGRLRIEGAGLIRVSAWPLGSELRAGVEHPMFLYAEGFYPVERQEGRPFRWMADAATFPLPALDATSAVIRIVAADPRPGGARPLRIAWRGAAGEVPLTASAAEHRLELAAVPGTAMTNLALSTPGWSPADHGSGDRRTLGARIYEIQIDLE